MPEEALSRIEAIDRAFLEVHVPSMVAATVGVGDQVLKNCLKKLYARENITCGNKRVKYVTKKINQAYLNDPDGFFRKASAETKRFMPTYLTRRQLQIVDLVRQGLSNREIGKALDLAEGAIKQHVRRIFDATGLSDRLDLAAKAQVEFLIGYHNSIKT